MDKHNLILPDGRDLEVFTAGTPYPNSIFFDYTHKEQAIRGKAGCQSLQILVDLLLHSHALEYLDENL
jgi:hypothetical protein